MTWVHPVGIFGGMARPVFSKNPIREAILDIRFTKALTLEQIEKCAAVYADDFPERKEIRTVQYQVTFGSTGPVKQTVPTLHGFQLWSTDKKRVLQVRKDGFSCAQLKPYTSWEDFLAVFTSAWARNQDAWRMHSIGRVATRYINEFSLPITPNGLADYFNGIPSVPGRPADQPTNFVSRTTIPLDRATGSDTHANVTFVYNGVQDGQYKLLLDLDVFRNGNVSAEIESIVDKCAILHEETENIFLQHLKELAKETIA